MSTKRTANETRSQEDGRDSPDAAVPVSAQAHSPPSHAIMSQVKEQIDSRTVLPIDDDEDDTPSLKPVISCYGLGDMTWS